MPDQTMPIVRNFSVADLPSPEVIRDRAIAATGVVSAEEAGANFRKAAEELCRRAGSTSEGLRQVGDSFRAMANNVAALGIGSVVKAAADAEAERMYRAREEGGDV